MNDAMIKECRTMIPPEMELAIERRFKRMYDRELKKMDDAEKHRKERARQAHEDVMEAYSSREQIINDWGCDLITTKEKNRMLKAWDDAHEPDREMDLYMTALRRELMNCNNAIRELERKGGFE